MSNAVIGVDAMSVPEVSRRAPGWIIRTLRILTALAALAAVAQPITAGLFVTGNVNMLIAHVMFAATLAFVNLLLVVACVLLWRPCRGSARAIVRPVILLVLVIGQAVLGTTRALEIHFPLAFVIIGLTMALVSWAWRDDITVEGGRA